MQDSAQYAKVIANSKRIRWDIDADVIRGRQFDYDKTFLPHGLSLATELPFLSAGQVRLFSQVQGRTYCYLFGLVERFIAAKVLGLSAHYWLGDQTPLEALVRLADEELKHQELFRRLEDRMEDAMPLGYIQTAEADAVAQFVLSKGDWAVLALTLHIELFTLAHYRASIDRDEDVCPLWSAADDAITCGTPCGSRITSPAFRRNGSTPSTSTVHSPSATKWYRNRFPAPGPSARASVAADGDSKRQGAVKRAEKNTAPLRLTTRRISESASMMGQ